METAFAFMTKSRETTSKIQTRILILMPKQDANNNSDREPTNLVADVAERGQEECHCLARAGFRYADDVAARQQHRPALRLDGRRLGVRLAQGWETKRGRVRVTVRVRGPGKVARGTEEVTQKAEKGNFLLTPPTETRKGYQKTTALRKIERRRTRRSGNKCLRCIPRISGPTLVSSNESSGRNLSAPRPKMAICDDW